MIRLIKLLSAAAVITATSAWGFGIAGVYRKRPQHLRQLQSGLQSLLTEITYGATPLPEALAAIGCRLDPPVAALFKRAAALVMIPGKTAAEAWHQGLHTLAADSAIKQEDLSVLRPLGQVLGLSDRQDQERHLLLALRHLLDAERQAEQERRQNENLWRYLGVLSGLMLVIVLM